MSKTEGMQTTIRAEPPTRENITEVARDIRQYWGSGGMAHSPNVCYRIKDGRMHLLRTYSFPDAGSDTKLLLIAWVRPDNRMSDYRADIYNELRRRGVGIRPTARTHLARMAARVQLAFEDESRAHHALYVYRYVKNGRVRVEVYSGGGDRASEGMVFVCRLVNDSQQGNEKRGKRGLTTAHYLEQIAAGLRAQGVDA